MTVADMTLRFGSLRVPTTVHWPCVETGSLAVVLSDELSPSDPWVESSIVIGLAGGHPAWIELATVRWAAEHAGELGADGAQLLVAGGARAARLALAARDSGWPVLRRQLLIHPAFSKQQPMPVDVGGASPATVVWAWRRDGGQRYADRLRVAGVEVQEVRGAGRR